MERDPWPGCGYWHTKIAIFIVNLETGEIVHQTGLMNPQIAYGEDVIARISYANQSSRHASELRSRFIDALNQEIENGCQAASIEPAQIVDAVIVGKYSHAPFLRGITGPPAWGSALPVPQSPSP